MVDQPNNLAMANYVYPADHGNYYKDSGGEYSEKPVTIACV